LAQSDWASAVEGAAAALCSAVFRTWPSVVSGARLLARVLGEKVRTWPSLVPRARLLAHALGKKVRTWPALVRQADIGKVRSSVQGLGAMARNAPSLIRRAHISTKAFGEVMLAVLLLATLAFSWRDGLPGNSYDGTAQAAIRIEALPGEQPSFGLTLPGLRNIPGWAKSTGELVSSRALIPTAPPVQLLIPSLNVHRPVEAVGVNRSRVMDLPVNAWNAGWYKGGPVPGAPGDAVIEGHAGYPDQPMIFGKLATLRPGDQILVVLSDGSRRLFIVKSMATLPVGVAPPGMAEPYGAPRLTLITCAGHFDEKTFSYSQRLVVEASYAGTV
jgi:hypothetical protein